MTAVVTTIQFTSSRLFASMMTIRPTMPKNTAAGTFSFGKKNASPVAISATTQ
ncbi:hypothetical protein [Cryptosporangium sp. NPDC048952]|uniref:hypothetical protein n=1 Tax=Cryptosporangium sp. NPDC048952 TaxID=3363961 RepID=UPI00371E3459